MENRISSELDELNIEQTERLLENDIMFGLDSAAMKRIRNSVYKKAGLKKRTTMLRKSLTVAAAAIVLVTLSSAVIGFDNVASAVGKLFGFVPGYGILENNQDIKYTVAGQDLRAENDLAILYLNTVVATKNTVGISFEVERKNFNENKLLEEKRKEDERLKHDLAPERLKITLETEGKQYENKSYSMGGGGKTDHIFIDFQLPEEAVNTDNTYTLNYRDINLSIVFKLKTLDSYSTLNEIGPTEVKNNISITAVARQKDKKLEVELYTINKSKFIISSYTKEYGDGYKGQDIKLTTPKAGYAYKTPDSYMGPNNKFYFDVPQKEEGKVLNVPYLLVYANESQNISLNIPKEGEKQTVNKRIKFDDSDMIITEVEHVKTKENPYGDLKIYFRYENNKPELVMIGSEYRRTDILGIEKGGGYSWSMDENGIVSCVDFSLEKEDRGTLRLKLMNPKYFLLGQYSLEINN